MGGIFGSSAEDRYFENQANQYGDDDYCKGCREVDGICEECNNCGPCGQCTCEEQSVVSEVNTREVA